MLTSISHFRSHRAVAALVLCVASVPCVFTGVPARADASSMPSIVCAGGHDASKLSLKGGKGASGIPHRLIAPYIPPAGSTCDDGSVIDLMVVYTTQARIAAGGTAAMNAHIDQAVAGANDAFTRSLINTSLRLVHTYEVSYVETGNYITDTNRYLDPNDGYLDDVPALRNQYGADCVSLWFDTYNYAGAGWYPDGTLTGINASGLTLMDWKAYSGLLLAHEIGHNLWCTHDRAHTTGTPYAEYSYGYIEPGNAWQDIMSQVPGVPQIPYFANPLVNWPGPNPPNPGPTGIPANQPNPCDLALTINQTRKIVANFRATVVPGLPSVLYVKAGAPAGGNGFSWATAFRDLQEALCRAAGSNGVVTQIWVAAGTYKPDRGTGDRNASFSLQNGLSVYGGFAGTETLLSQRNIAANPTILSGDIGVANNASDNSYHVVKTASGTDATARLDGFTLSGGNANGAYPDGDGGGLFVVDGGPTIVSCTFIANSASGTGGGAFNRNANPLYDQCTFSQNTAGAGGGGLTNWTSSATLKNCTFLGNSAPYGGGSYNEGSGTQFYANCRFLANFATGQSGGGLYNSGASPTLVSCLFSGNQANWYGAAVVAFGTGSQNTKLVNCTISRNTATIYGGGLAIDQSGPVLTNVVLWGNTDSGGTTQDAQITRFGGASVSINRSIVQGWNNTLGGTGNNGSNPLFIDDNGADNLVGTLDDNLRLQAGSPALDSGDTAALPADTADLDADTNLVEPTPLDLDNHPRVLNTTVDRGAYERVPVIPGDFDSDGDVDDTDFATFQSCATRSGITQPNPACAAAKLDADTDVDMNDFGLFQRCYSGAGLPGRTNCTN